MKTWFAIGSGVLAFGLLGGCGRSDDREMPAAASDAQARPLEKDASGVTVRVIQCDDRMKFDIERIEVTAGETVVIELRNVGKMPKEAMGHNWVLLKQGADVQGYLNAAVMARTTDYIPAALNDQVVAHTQLLGPGQRERVTFTAPEAAGQYIYVCTFPAHYAVGMKGVLVVK